MKAVRPDRSASTSLLLDDAGGHSIRTRSGHRSGSVAVLLAAAGVMLSGQIVHPLAQPRYDQGPVGATFRLGYIQMMFQQTPAQRQALEQLLAAQRDPSSSSYQNWLTPEQYADRFGLSRTDLARVTAWLRTSGFRIENTARGRDWIAFSGTAAQVEAAFRASIHRYAIGGETHFGVATEPVIPSELNPLVATIFGLNDFYPKSMLKPAFTSGPGVLVSPSLAPGDLATIYDINPLYQQGVNGSGQKIVIVGESAIDISDIQQFRRNYGLGAATVKMVQIGTPSTELGPQMEADLDLEWAGAIAPNATLIYVYGADAGSAALYAIDQDLAPVVSMSYGVCEAGVQPSMPSQFQAEAKKANALGITWVASSGDSGAAACDDGATLALYGLAVNFPASVPEITAVGGTEFQEGNGNYWGATNRANGGSALEYIPEMAWNDTGTFSDLCNDSPPPNGAGAAPCLTLAATGGGVSMQFFKPFWQVGPGVPADGQRDLPDISFAASDGHDPYNIITSGQLVQIGGTSASTPVFAGILALLNQELKTNGVGNINPALYELAVSSPSMFHDIVNNNNMVPCACEGGGDIGYNAGVAYDLTTGLGSVNVNNLVTGWTAATAGGATPVISSVANAASYQAGVVAPGEMVVISGTGLGPEQLGLLAMTSSGLVSTQYSSNALITVQFNGFAAPLIYTSSTAIAVVVPYEVTGSTAQVTVTYQGRTSAPVTVNVSAAVPGVFTANASGSGQAAAFNSDGTLNSSAKPATQGSTITVYGTGEGQTSPGGVDGKLVVAPLPTPLLPITVTIGGVQAAVPYAGPAYGEVAGMLQMNVVVPPNVSGSAVPVVVQAGNAVSQAGVTLAVGPPAFAVTSQEVVGAVASSNGVLTCSAAPAKSSFLTTDPAVWVYFTFNGAQNGDVIVANWLHPSGQLDANQPSLTLNYSGSGCAAAPLSIAGTEVAQDPGNWQVKIFRNGTFQFSLPFTIAP